MLDYIKQQMQQGVSQEQIKNSLIATGWQQQDIDEGLNSLATQGTPSPSVAAPVAPTPTNSTWKIVLGVVIGVAILGGGAYLASQTVFKPKKTTETSTNTTTAQTTQQPAAVATETPTQSQNPEMVFADKLSSCTPNKTSFTHPLTGETLEKEVLGIADGKCGYVEQMPNNGKMECKYTESERSVAAQYYKDVASAETAESSVSGTLGSSETKATYTIDGKTVDNPLQEFMNSGVCTITGY